MCLLFETIACKNGKLLNLEWHNARLNNSRRELFKSRDSFFLEKIIIPPLAKKGVWKCKVVYSTIIHQISFFPYKPRKINTLILVKSNLKYNHKFKNREEIDFFFNRKKNADDIIIIKDGYVTDSSIANILFFNGKFWITPDTPLLKGTMRAHLINTNLVQVNVVKKTDLGNYKKLMLVNAMNPFDENRGIDIAKTILNY